MRSDITPFILDRFATIRDAIAKIEKNATGIVMIITDSGVLIGTATDGDIRRALLEGKALSTPISLVMRTDPTVVTPNATEDEVLRILRLKRIQLIPVVSAEGRVLGAHLLSEYLHQLGPAEGKPFPAVIMAGGLGTRLRPFTENTPKPLIEIGGKPILERIVHHISKAGAKNLVITTRHLAEQIEGYFGDGQPWDIEITYLREETRQGTAGSLRDVQDSFTTPFLVMNADILTNFDIQQMFRFHEEHNAWMTVGVRHYSFQVPYGVVEVSGSSIIGLSEKPVIDFFVNAGIYIINPTALRYIPPSGFFDITELIEILLANEHPVANFPFIEQWMDIGRPEDLAEANAIFSPTFKLASE